MKLYLKHRKKGYFILSLQKKGVQIQSYMYNINSVKKQKIFEVLKLNTLRMLLILVLSYNISRLNFFFFFQNEREQVDVQAWSLICDTMLTRGIRDGTRFQLRQGDISLLCSVHALPYLSISEEIIDPKSNKFVLRLNSETSV